MKNILDKRQLSYKLTANSLMVNVVLEPVHFMIKMLSRSTTATGRMLLTYAKKELFKNLIMMLC